MNNNDRFNTIKEIITESAEKPYRFEQIKQAILNQSINKYSEISNIPKNLKQLLSEKLGDNILSLTEVANVSGPQVSKSLFETSDGKKLESVLMSYKQNNLRSTELRSLCVSSQIGCAMDCKFCATGAIGFIRNLTADEIVDQVLWYIKKDLKPTNIIFMGMGEPFANTPEVLKALSYLTSSEYLNMSQRRISVSTVGIIPGIQRLTKEFPQVNLAFSLHSPFNEERERLMPITKAYKIEDVFEALNNHLETTNRKIFVSYLLLDGVNDTKDHAKQLAKLIKAQGKKSYLYHVNLIRYNPAPAVDAFDKPQEHTVNMFKYELEKNRIETTLRQDFGVEIDAGCGQLYAKYGAKKK